MIINIIRPQFPTGSLADIESKKSSCESLELNFSSGSNLAISPETISQFSDYVKKNFKTKSATSTTSTKPVITIELKGIDSLSPESVVTLLRNRDFVNYLHHSDFRELIVTSEAATAFSLANEYITKKLDSIEPDIDSQTFSKSCAARAIMKLLQEHKLLTKKDETRTNELKIYSKIWDAPGMPASPEKIIESLSKLPLNVKGIEIKDLSEQTLADLKSSHESIYPQFERAHTLFRRSVEGRLLLMDSKNINEEAFSPGVSSLLVTSVTEDTGIGTHIVFAKKNDADEFEVLNPSDGSIIKYSSFQDFVENESTFLGVGIHVEKGESKLSR